MAAGMEGGCDGTSVKGSPGLHLNPSQKAQAVAMASLQHLARFEGELSGPAEQGSRSSTARSPLLISVPRLPFKTTGFHS